MRMLFCLAGLCAMIAPPSRAQFLPDLQAKTPAEFDAYLDVLDGPAIEKGEVFVRAFPDSALLLPVYELLAKSWRAQGNAANAIAAAANGLAIAPEYPPLLVELAVLLANGSTGLDRAESAATRALDLLGRVKAPVRVPPDVWLAAVASLKARAHEALGLVLFKRNDTPGAIREFQLSLDAAPDATVHYRIGRLYAVTDRPREARPHLSEAARSGDEALRKLARAALAALPR